MAAVQKPSMLFSQALVDGQQGAYVPLLIGTNVQVRTTCLISGYSEKENTFP